MLEQVESKIQQLEKQRKEEYYKRRDEDLIEWGLTSKQGKKISPLIVTEEEYEALSAASNALSGAGRNKVAKRLNACAALIIALGIIAGILIYIFCDNLGFAYASACIVGSILAACLFRGIAEAVRLLQQLLDLERINISRKSHEHTKKGFPDTQPSAKQQFANAPEVHFEYPYQHQGAAQAPTQK